MTTLAKQVECDYCGELAKPKRGNFIYPGRPDLACLNFYYCDNGHDPAYVGCHKGTMQPLGRLATAELRAAKCGAHNHFDPLWRDNYMSRSEAYAWLREAMNMTPKDCHIGKFDIPTCHKAEKLCRRKLAEVRHENYPG